MAVLAVARLRFMASSQAEGDGSGEWLLGLGSGESSGVAGAPRGGDTFGVSSFRPP